MHEIKPINTLPEYYIKINYGEMPLPRIKLNKKETVVEEGAERDKTLNEICVKFTREYFKKRYIY